MLRAGDIAALKVGDVNLTNNTLHAYIEKTDSHDDLPITSELHAELVCWFKAYADTMGLGSWLELPNDWTLVPAADYLANNVWEPESGGRIRYKVYGRYAHNWEIVQRALTRLGHPTKFEGFHTLRRSGARLVYEAAKADGMADPIRIAQAQLGHGDQRVTERYLGLEPDKVRRDELLRGRSFLAAAVERETGATVTDLDGETLRSGGVVGL
jgi:integrase